MLKASPRTCSTRRWKEKRPTWALGTTWAAFSGVLTSETIDAADWTVTKKKVPGTHSKNVFDITEILDLDQELPSPPTPMQHVVYQLTDAKVHAQLTSEGYQAPVLPAPLLLPWPRARLRCTSASATPTTTTTRRTPTPRTRTRTMVSRARTRYRSDKSVSRELWPLQPPSYAPATPPV